MDTLKSLFVVLFFMLNSLCHAIEIECSICHKRFERKTGTSGTRCYDCNELIAAVKAWRQGCPECRQYSWLDLCPDCLDGITKQDDCNNQYHNLYGICTICLKAACKANDKYDGKESPNCLITGCTNPIDPKRCCGYPTGLCSTHNDQLRNSIKEHKRKCKLDCKRYPFLDLCPECIALINSQKGGHTECIWENTPYDVYVPCETCLACYACE